jgi:hypothetical protein
VDPGLEVEMSNPFRIAIVVATLLLAVVVAGPACRPCPEQPAQTEEKPEVVVQEDPSFVHEIQVDLDKDGIQWALIQPVKVGRGEAIRFTVQGHTAWVLIPESGFRLVSGGSDWVVGESITAFKVEKGSALIMLDNSFEETDPVHVIHYSVLARHVDGPWEYVHGENPPPKMIIPPKKSSG